MDVMMSCYLDEYIQTTFMHIKPYWSVCIKPELSQTIWWSFDFNAQICDLRISASLS